MTDKEYKKMMDEAEEYRKEVENYTKEEALALLCRVGILDKDGNFTKPYKNLARVVKNI
jgi:hypothetical protein